MPKEYLEKGRNPAFSRPLCNLTALNISLGIVNLFVAIPHLAGLFATIDCEELYEIGVEIVAIPHLAGLFATVFTLYSYRW